MAGEVPARLVYSDEEIVAFHDVRPQAPVHVLVVPRRHLRGLPDVVSTEQALLGRLLWRCAELARGLGLGGGYRVVVNSGPDGGQTVGHLHLHLLGGRPMAWPPG